jgi:hypothetical protein
VKAFLGEDGTVVLDGEVVTGAYCVVESPQVAYPHTFYLRTVRNRCYGVGLSIDRTLCHVWAKDLRPIGDNGEVILEFVEFEYKGEVISSFAEAINYCVWKDTE